MEFGIGVSIQAFDIKLEFTICPVNWLFQSKQTIGIFWCAIGPLRITQIDFRKLHEISKEALK
jgi:hypothetical protein